MSRSTLQYILLACGLCLFAPVWLGADAGCGGSGGAADGAAGAASQAGSTAAGGTSAGRSAGGVGGAKPAGAGQGASGRSAAGGGSSAAGHTAMIDQDAGMCVSELSGPCGGNTRSPCACASGLVCTADPGSSLPMGDVGGTCQPPKSGGSCKADTDCRLQADYCTGCDCVALAAGENVRACSGPGVRCLADPCARKTAACDSGKCVAR